MEWKISDEKPVNKKNVTKSSLADRSMYGKYHDYKSVDLRDIMSLFDDYLSVETSIKNKY